MDELTMRARYLRAMTLLKTLTEDPEPDEQDTYFERYDAAIEAAKKLLAEEARVPIQ